MEQMKEKIIVSNKIYPYLSGLSDDLLFWAAINTIFLTTVKNFNASQISLLSAISMFVSIIFQGIVYKIIKKIGNLKSVKLGLIILFVSSVIITFGNSFVLIAIGLSLYQLAFLFRTMDSVILKKNLKYLNEEDRFIEIQSKGSIIYSISTMIISFMAGFLFNINNYLPMIICSAICFVNIIFSRYLYECPVSYENDNNIKNNKVFKWSKIIFLIILLYGLLYATLETTQENGKIFIQQYLQDYTSLDKTAVYLSIIITLSRVSRVLSNVFFNKIYKKIKNKFIVILNMNLILAILFMIVGKFMLSETFGIVVMSIGFCMVLWGRDPILNFLRNELLNNCSNEHQQKAMLNFNLSRKIIRCILATLVSFILLKVDMIYIMFFLAIIVLIYTIFTFKLYTLLENKKLDYNI